MLVTHDPDVGAVCDRIIHMRDGLVEAAEWVAEGPDDRFGEAVA